MFPVALFIEILIAVSVSIWFFRQGAYRKPYPKDGAIIGGVCTGLAEHFDIPVNAIRIIFLAASILLLGAGIATYLVMCFVLPDKRETRESEAK